MNAKVFSAADAKLLSNVAKEQQQYITEAFAIECLKVLLNEIKNCANDGETNYRVSLSSKLFSGLNRPKHFNYTLCEKIIKQSLRKLGFKVSATQYDHFNIIWS